MNHADDFEAFVHARWTRMVRAVVLMGCPVADAEDVVQTALTKAYLNWGRVRRAESPEAYVHTIVVNTYVSSRRRKWHGERPTEEFPEVIGADPSSRSDDASVVAASLAKISHDHRVVVVLRHFVELSEIETAAVLGVPVGTVKSRFSRALKALAADSDLSDLADLEAIA